MKKQFAVVVCLLMALAVTFTGCLPGLPANVLPSNNDSIEGTWEASIDISDEVNEMMVAGDPTMSEYFNFSGLAMEFTMTFNADGTCTGEIPQKSAEDLLTNMVEQMKPGMTRMIEDMLAAQGLDMSVDEFLSMSGISLDEMFGEAMDSLDVEEMLGDAANMKGRYVAKDGKLYLSDDPDLDPDEDDYYPYTIANDTLTIEVSEDEKDEDYAALLFPLVLKRVK